jgi:hypothetical protein
MFDLADKMPDNINDDVRPLLKALSSRKHWNDEAKINLAKLTKLLR